MSVGYQSTDAEVLNTAGANLPFKNPDDAGDSRISIAKVFPGISV